MRYRVLIAILGLLVATATAQVSPHPFRGNITTAGADCATATNCVVVTLPNDTASATISIDTATGSFSGTLNCEQSVDGGAWIASTPTANSTSSSCTALSSGGSWQINPASYIRLRVRASVRASGTAAITINWGPATASSSGSGGGTSVNINGSSVASPNFNVTTPAAPANKVNVTWQASSSSVSGYVPDPLVFANLSTSTAKVQGPCAATKFLRQVDNAATSTNCDAIVAADVPAVTLTSGTSRTLANGAEIVICTSTCTVTPPGTLTAGQQFCVQNDDNVSTVITLAAVTAVQYEATARTSYGTANHTMTSGGAVKDQICMVAVSTTKFNVFSSVGTWTNN